MSNITWDPTNTGTGVTLTNGNLTATVTAPGSVSTGTWGQTGQTSGKYYFEAKLVSGGGTADTWMGIGQAGLTWLQVGNGACLRALLMNTFAGTIYCNGVRPTGSPVVGGVTTTTPWCFAIDLDNMRFFARAGAAGNWNGSGTATPATPSTGVDISAIFSTFNTLRPVIAFGYNAENIIANFGDSAFTGAVPAGYTSGWPFAAGTPALVASQVGVEVYEIGNPALRVSQIGAEVFYSLIPALMVSQVGVEIAFVAGQPPLAPAAGALAITGFAPAIGISVAPDAGALTITGFAPGGGGVLAPAAGQLTITGFAPVGGSGLAPDAGALTITGFAPVPIARPGGGPMISIIV